MNPVGKGLYLLGYGIAMVFILFVLLPPLALFIFLYIIITLPYTLFFFSANWSMQSKHFPPVEVYLAHFERLHPELMAYVALAHERFRGQNTGSGGIEFWPHKTKHETVFLIIATITETQWSFTQAAGFLARLEDAGWNRRLVWTFLRDRVEQAGVVSQEEREAFARVMELMNSHRILNVSFGHGTIWNSISLHFRGNDHARQLEEAAAARYAHLGRPIEHAREDSLEWVLHRGAVVLPNNATRAALGRLAVFAPVWGAFKKDSDLEQGIGDFWQIADARTFWPWTEK